ncbi:MULTISPECIES: ribonucleoside-triphosphate reductase, adenosylcobalamin-dependent [Streptomyces]
MTTFKTETAETVFLRTYSRTKPDGSKETWNETVERVVDGNLALVDPKHIKPGEREKLIEFITGFKVLPAGRHLSASGVNDYALNNCWASGWLDDDPAEHFTFLFARLMEGGGVGANYSDRYLEGMPAVAVPVNVHIVCDPEHPNYLDMVEAGVISTEYGYDWAGAYAVQDSREGWQEALRDLINTAYEPATTHRNRVYDVSRVRKRGAPLRKFGGSASGPLPFAQMMQEVGKTLAAAGEFARPLSGMEAMEIDHEIARCVVSGGVRRSARMSIMHWADPGIFQFINAKKSLSKHWTTNLSIETDRSFRDAIRAEDTHAHKVLEAMAEGMHVSGEPGFWDSSMSAEGEPDGTYCTNPCGEITLNPWEPCNLGHVNLGAFVDAHGVIDFRGLFEAHRLITRYLIRATHAKVADPKSRVVIDRNRRIGVGHFGYADYLAKQGLPYSSSHDLDMVRVDLREFAAIVDKAATEYAHQLRIPIPVKRRTIAPTGTVAKLAGASGEGIHPIFARYFIRRIRFSTVVETERAQVEQYAAKGYLVEPDQYAANTMVVAIPTVDPLALDCPGVESVDEIEMGDMLRVQAMYQEVWADNAVSMTVNFDTADYTPAGLARMVEQYAGKLKGTTVFPELKGFAQAPYERITEARYNELISQTDGSAGADTGYDEICASGACPI